MRFYSLFAGIGGFDLGLTRAGHECVGACESEGWKRAVYARCFPGVKIDPDARKVDTDTLPDFEIMCGGFPCQAFSNAGMRRGLADPRGDICFEIARIAKTRQPQYLFLENVPALLNHEDGKTFEAICTSLDEVGYDVSWQVINGKYFLPQQRKRVYIVGCLRGSGARQIFPLTGCQAGHIRAGRKKQDFVPTLTCGSQSHNGEAFLHQLNDPEYGPYRIYSPKGLARTIMGNAGGVGAKTGLYVVPKDGENKLRMITDWTNHGNYRVYSADGLARTIQSSHNKTGLYVVPCLTPDRGLRVRQHGRRFKEPGEPAFTLTASDKHGVMVNDDIRRLTPIECERLMGFPDGWTACLPDTKRYNALGDAVMVPIIEHLGRLLSIEALQ